MPSSDDDIQRMDERRGRKDRRRSRSSSRSNRYRDKKRSSRSRSRSVERYRRRHSRSHRSRSRSRRSRSDSRYSRHHRSSRSSRRYVDSRSRSRSRSHNRSYTDFRKDQSSSRSPRPIRQNFENKKSCSRSSERYFKKKDTNDDQNSPTRSNSESRKSVNDENSSSQLPTNTDTNADANSLEDLPLPDQADTNGTNYELLDDSQEPIDKERIHREIEEKLRLALAKEGKIYPPPKPEASHPVFANDGSFLEIFKKMQEAQKSMTAATTTSTLPYGVAAASTSTAALHPTMSAAAKTGIQPPLVGRRRGGKILKTGVVAKPKAINNTGDDKDFWSLYLAEVNKYKNNACELNSGNRPLLK